MKESPGHDHDDHEEDDADPYGGEAGEDTHSVHEIDEHVWTSPVNAQLLVENIRDMLVSIDPDRARIYEENAAAYLKELRALDADYRQMAENARRKTLVFGDRFPFLYLVRTYGLEYYAAFPGCSGETEPSAATIAFLTDKVREEQIPTVWYIEFSNHLVADSIAESAGVKTAMFHTCHNVSADDLAAGATYVSLMEQKLETLRGNL